MKSYEEMAECVFKRSKEQLAMKKRRRKKISITAGLCGICLLVICSLSLLRNSDAFSNPRAQNDAGNHPGNESDGTDYSVGTNPGGREQSEQDPLDKNVQANPGKDKDAGQIKLVVNEIASSSGDMDLKLDVLSEDYDKSSDAWNDVITDFETFTGIDYEKILSAIPEEFTDDYTLYALLARHRNEETLETYELHDYVFDFTSGDDISIHIALCPYEAPLRDYFIETENPDISDVYGTPVTVYGFDQFYIAECVYQGIYYDIETRGLSLDQLTTLLASLFKS